MFYNPRRLRRPEERVGKLSNAALPPPNASAVAEADAVLVRSLRARDEEAFERVINQYYTPMLRLAMQFVRSREEAEEVIQDTWLAVLSGIDGFESRSSFKTWLFRILVNRARSRAKREARTVAFSAIAPAGASYGSELQPLESARPAWATNSPETRDPEENVLARELNTRIESAIATLPRGQQAVITLRDVEGWSADEVCDALDITQINQRVLLHRARARVRKALGSYVEGERCA